MTTDKDQLYITNYKEPGCFLLESITRLPTDEAYALAKILSAKCVSERNRFGDYFDTYYKKRLRTEEWLYQSFKAAGGNPQTQHPLYFVLQENRYLYNWFGQGTITKIRLQEINSAHISFTFGDSLAKMDTDHRRDPFSKELLFQLIDQANGDVEVFLASIANQYGYIEVQLWNDIYLQLSERVV